MAGDADGLVRVWTLPTPVLRTGGPAYSVAYGRGGHLLAVGGPGLQLWDPVTRTQLAAATVPGPAGTTVNPVAFSPGGATLAAGYSDGKMQLWGVTPAGALAPLSQPVLASAKGMVECATFSPDGRLLATSGDDGTVRLWSVTDPAHPRLRGHLARLGHLRVLGGVQPGRPHARGGERGRSHPAVERQPA